jgi:hypothetical protein
MAGGSGFQEKRKKREINLEIDFQNKKAFRKLNQENILVPELIGKISLNSVEILGRQ